MIESPVRSRRFWLRFLQAAVTVSLMGWVLSLIDWPNLWFLTSHLHWGYVMLGAALVLATHLINVSRWQYLLQSARFGYLRLLVLYAAGLFSNNFLPTGFGGDGVRALFLGRSLPLPQAIASVVLDRGLALAGLSALLVVGLWNGSPLALKNLLATLLPNSASLPQWLLACLVLTVVASLILTFRRSFPETLFTKIEKAFTTLKLQLEPLFQSAGWPRLVLGGYLVSTASHLCLAMAYWALLQAVGIEVAGNAAIWLVLLVSLASLFPLAINGLGVQEAMYVWTLSTYGVAGTPAVLAALLTRLVATFFVLLAGAGWLLGHRLSAPAKNTLGKA